MTDSNDDLPTRDDVLARLDTAMAEAEKKVESGRVYDSDAEQTRQGWIRALCRSAAEYRKLLADRDDLDDLRERVEEIEAEQADNPHRIK
jgi:hypothetical protein